MKAAFQHCSPVPIPPPKASAKLIGIAPGSDHIAADLKWIADIEQNASDNSVVWPGLCKQHASGLVIAPAVKVLGIASPAFCTCNQLKRDKFLTDLMASMRQVIAQGEFRWIKASSRPMFQMSTWTLRISCELVRLTS